MGTGVFQIREPRFFKTESNIFAACEIDRNLPFIFSQILASAL